MSGIKVSYYNQNLFSGSSDTLRTEIGGYWQIEAIDGSDSVAASFTSAKENATIENETVKIYGNIIDSVKSGFSLSTTSSAKISVPSLKMPIRLVGNEDTIEDDFDWRTKILNIFSPGVRNDTNFKCDLLYQPLYIKTNDNKNFSNYKTGKINYKYNYYLPEYQNFVNEFTRVNTIPNYYHYLSKHLGYEEQQNIENYVSLEGKIDAQSILSNIETIYPPTYDITSADIELTSDTYIDKLHSIKKYLSSSYSIVNSISSSTLDQVSLYNSNQYFNLKSQSRLFDTAMQMENKFPYMVTIKFPVADVEGDFCKMIQDSGYENILLNYIKTNFVYSKPGFAKYRSVKTNITSSKKDVFDLVTSNDTSVSSAEFYQILLNTLSLNSLDAPSDFYIMGGQNETREQIKNTDGVARYSKSIPSLKLLQSLQSYLKNNFYFSNTADLHLSDILDKASSQQDSEIVAYRISKSNGIRSISNANDTLVQNFFVSALKPNQLKASSSERDGLTIYDSQVKYGEYYTYIVYAYMVVSGYDYSYDDLVISRQIATTEDASSNEIHCLEFFDPGSDKTSAALYKEDPASEETQNDLFTEAQISTYHRYLADFNVSVEPSIKFVEVPIFIKSVKVLDHPLPTIDVNKFQRMNNSKVIGFFSNIDPFVSKKFPHVLTMDDQDYKNDYLISNDLLESEKISTPAQSNALKLQIFKKTDKPNAINDFNENDLYSEKILTLDNSNFSLSSCLYEEKINVNTKYYYTIRLVGQNNNIGHITNVIEAELIDDGGYVYSMFEEFGENDFHTAVKKQVSEQFKKLFRLIPDINQINFDDTNVDFDNHAKDEMDNLKVGTAEDSIFGKTFKIRLTSKKTGKKIDLNVTYKLI